MAGKEVNTNSTNLVYLCIVISVESKSKVLIVVLDYNTHADNIFKVKILVLMDTAFAKPICGKSTKMTIIKSWSKFLWITGSI